MSDTDSDEEVPFCHCVNRTVEMRDGSLGNEVRKDFPGFGMFNGEVVEFDNEGGGEGTEEHYHVSWADGDEEDLSPLEYVEARKLWLELQSAPEKPGKKKVPVFLFMPDPVSPRTFRHPPLPLPSLPLPLLCCPTAKEKS